MKNGRPKSRKSPERTESDLTLPLKSAGANPQPPPDTPSPTLADLTEVGDPRLQAKAKALAHEAITHRPIPSVPGYVILDEIGRGGMGVVYLAHHNRLNRPCALKMILVGAHADSATTQRFMAEAEAVAQLRHLNVVQIYAYGEVEGLPYFELEYLEGGSLESRLDGTPWAADHAAALVEPLTRAITLAHSLGLIHRDLKPSNILIHADGTPKITDFGLAKSLNSDTHLTATDAILGTPSYMSPEQADGKVRETTAAADIYALGTILYELVTGRPPFKGATTLDTLNQVKSTLPVPPRRLQPALPRDLETITLKCLQKEPLKRYLSAQALADDLHRFLRGEPILARPVGPLERAKRWCLRNPLVAILSALIFGLLAVASLVSTTLWLQVRLEVGRTETQRLFALKAATMANAARLEAEKANAALRSTEDQLRNTLYATRTNLALAAFQQNDVGELRKLVDRCKPNPGEPDLRGWEWSFLSRLSHEEAFTFRDHTRGVSRLAFHPGGRLIASSQGKGTLKLWDAATGIAHFTLEPLKLAGALGPLSGGVNGLAFSPDGTLLAVAASDESISLVDTKTGLRRSRFLVGNGPILNLAFSPDGRRLAAAFAAHTLGVFEVDTTKRLLEIGNHGGPVTGVAYTPDGRSIVTSSYDKTLKIFDAQSGLERLVLRGHDDFVNALAVSPGGQQIASGSSDHTVRLWNPETGKEIITLRGHTAPVLGVAFSPRGNRLASCGIDQTILLWDVSDGTLIRAFKGHTDFVSAVAFSSDRHTIASSSRDGSVKLWDTATLPQPLTLKAPSLLPYDVGYNHVAVSPDGHQIASAHSDRTVKVWDVSTGKLQHVLKGHEQAVVAVAYSPDGRTIASSGEDKSIRLWNSAGGELIHTLLGHSETISDLAYSPDGRTLASAGPDKTIKLWDIATALPRQTLTGHSEGVQAIAFSPDGRMIASGGFDNDVKIWNPATGALLRTLQSHNRSVHCLAFSPDSRRLASGSDDNTLKIWDPETALVQLSFDAHSSRIHAVAFTTDGRRIASASDDKTVKLWDAGNGQNLLTLKDHAGAVHGLAFTNDGHRLITSSADRTVKVWDATPLPAPTP